MRMCGNWFLVRIALFWRLIIESPHTLRHPRTRLLDCDYELKVLLDEGKVFLGGSAYARECREK